MMLRRFMLNRFKASPVLYTALQLIVAYNVNPQLIRRMKRTGSEIDLHSLEHFFLEGNDCHIAIIGALNHNAFEVWQEQDLVLLRECGDGGNLPGLGILIQETELEQ